jgi:hypothetical protein
VHPTITTGELVKALDEWSLAKALKLLTWAQLIQQNRLKMQVKKLTVPRFRFHFRSIRSVSHLDCMAGTTGLEPATSAVTVRSIIVS